MTENTQAISTRRKCAGSVSLLAPHFVQCLDGLPSNERGQLHAVLKVSKADIFEIFVWTTSLQKRRNSNARAIEFTDDHRCNVSIHWNEIGSPEKRQRLASETHGSHHVWNILI